MHFIRKTLIALRAAALRAVAVLRHSGACIGRAFCGMQLAPARTTRMSLLPPPPPAKCYDGLAALAVAGALTLGLSVLVVDNAEAQTTCPTDETAAQQVAGWTENIHAYATNPFGGLPEAVDFNSAISLWLDGDADYFAAIRPALRNHQSFNRVASLICADGVRAGVATPDIMATSDCTDGDEAPANLMAMIETLVSGERTLVESGGNRFCLEPFVAARAQKCVAANWDYNGDPTAARRTQVWMTRIIAYAARVEIDESFLDFNAAIQGWLDGEPNYYDDAIRAALRDSAVYPSYLTAACQDGVRAGVSIPGIGTENDCGSVAEDDLKAMIETLSLDSVPPQCEIPVENRAGAAAANMHSECYLDRAGTRPQCAEVFGADLMFPRPAANPGRAAYVYNCDAEGATGFLPATINTDGATACGCPNNGGLRPATGRCGACVSGERLRGSLCIPERGDDFGALPEDLLCEAFGGNVQNAAGGRQVCSGMDAADTFCIADSEAADGHAFACRGLFKHVRQCHFDFRRPALNPFLCAPRCATNETPSGGVCES